VRVRMELRSGFMQRPADDLVRFRETFAAGKFRTVIYNRRTKAGNGSNLRNLDGNVTGAEDDDSWHRENRFDEDLGGFELHDPRSFFANHGFGSCPDIGFDGIIADRTQARSVLAYEQLGGSKARPGAGNSDDGCQRRLLSKLSQALDFVKDVKLHKAFSLTYLLTLLSSV